MPKEPYNAPPALSTVEFMIEVYREYPAAALKARARDLTALVNLFLDRGIFTFGFSCALSEVRRELDIVLDQLEENDDDDE